MQFIKKNIRNMVKGIINEYNSPDHVFLVKNGKTERLAFRDDDAIGFFLRNSNGDFYCNNSKTHLELKYDYIANKLGFNSNDEYNDYVDNNPSIESEALEEEFEALEAEIVYRGSECLEGRYWINDNIISFWYEIPSFIIFNKIMNGIASFTHTNINVNDVIITVGDDDLITAKDYYNSNNSKNIDKEKSAELRALHLMNAEEKAQTSQMQNYLQNKSANIGKKLKYQDSNGEMTMAQWRALHNTSENKQDKINTEMSNKIKLTENELRDIIKETIHEIIDNDSEYSKDDEIEASWDAFENTFNQEKDGNLPTRLGNKDFENFYYNVGKYNYDNAVQNIGLDYPNAFSTDDKYVKGRAAMDVLDDNHPHLQHLNKYAWNGKAKNGRIDYTDDVVESVNEENAQFDVDVSEAIDAWDLSNILKKYGWCYTDSQDIFDNRTQRSGVRYVLRGKPNAEDLEIVVDEIKRKAIDGEHTIETSSAYYKYDPSKTIPTLIVWETTLSPQMTLPFESKIRKMVHETVCEIGRYNGEYDRTGMALDDDEYINSIDYIIDSVINGNSSQVRELVRKLTYSEVFDLIDLAREMGTQQFI